MKKIAKWTGIIFLVLLVLIIALPFVFKGKIITKIKEEANKNLNAKVDFGEFDLTLFKSFPNFTLSINNVLIAGVNEFEKDTLADIKTLSATVDLMSVISGGQIKIKSIFLDEPGILAKVLKNGKANWDIAKPSTDTDESDTGTTSFKIALNKYEIKNGTVIYNDSTLDFRMEMTGLNHFGKGDFTQDLFVLQTQTDAASVSVSYGGVKYINKSKTNLKADLDMDMPNFKFTFKQNELQLNELFIGLDGFLAMPKEDIDMDLKFSAKKTDFKNFLSMVPGIYTKDFASVKTSGKLGFDGFVKGIFSEKSMPSFGINLLIENGMFQYPALPISVNNIEVNLKVINPDGNMDHTLVNLSKLHIELGKEPFDAKMILKTPVSDPDIDMHLKGKIELGNIQQIVPLEKGTRLSGILVSDLSAKGRLSSVQNKKYEEFNAAGQIDITDFLYSDATSSPSANIRQMQMGFNPKNVTLNKFDAVVGRSDFQLSGTLNNFIAYFLKGETLNGTLNLTSNQIDVNEFMKPSSSSSSATTTDTTPLSVIEVPANIDFVLTSKIGKVIYDNMLLQNVKGNIAVKEQAIHFSDVGFEMLDGSIKINGLYETVNPKQPSIDFNLTVSGFDIQQTFKTFVTVQKIAPVAGHCTGKFSSTTAVAGKLDEHMAPILNTLNGGGGLSTKNILIQGFEPVNKMADALKMEKYKKMELNDINLSFKFKDGKIEVAPFDVKIYNAKTWVQGSNGFDQTIDYVMNMEIPRSEFGGAANTVIDNLVSQVNSKGANISVGDKVNLNVFIKGTVTQPAVTTGLKETAGDAAETLKEKAKAEIDKKKKELEEKSKAEAERLKKEAENRLNTEKEKARAEAERLKNEAEEKAKAEAERLKKETEEKAKKELQNKFKGILKPK